MERRTLGYLRIPESDREILVKLADLSEVQTEEILRALEGQRPAIRREDLLRLLEDRVSGFSKQDLRRFVDVLLSLLSVRASISENISEVAALISNNSQLTLKDETRIRLRDRLIRLLSVESLILGWKAIDVLQEHERTFHSARTISEIRPIFGDDVSIEPTAAVVVHSLKITYHSDGGELRNFFVGLDNNDLQMMIDTLTRAREKSVSLTSMLNRKDVLELSQETDTK